MDGLVYRETRGGGSDRAIVAKRLKAALAGRNMRKVNRGKIWRSRLMPTQDVVCLWHCLASLQAQPLRFAVLSDLTPLWDSVATLE
jgi:hypothetical protein